MNLFILQHGYLRSIIQQAGGKNVFTTGSYARGASDDEHIITTGWWCKAAVMIDYHRRLVRRSDGDSYQPACSYEPRVILSSPTVHITNRW